MTKPTDNIEQAGKFQWFYRESEPLSSKNNYICWIPDHVIVRDVEDFLNEINSGKENYTSQKLEYALTILLGYAAALVQVRNSGELDYQRFPYGM